MKLDDCCCAASKMYRAYESLGIAKNELVRQIEAFAVMAALARHLDATGPPEGDQEILEQMSNPAFKEVCADLRLEEMESYLESRKETGGLWRALKSADLISAPWAFFRHVVPSAFSDPAAYQWMRSLDPDRIPMVCSLVCEILRIGGEAVGTEAILDLKPHELYAQRERMNLFSEAAFVELWAMIHYKKFVWHPPQISDAVTDALAGFQSRGQLRAEEADALLRAFLTARLSRESYMRSNFTDLPEDARGISEIQSRLVDSICMENPLTILHYARYSQLHRDDARLECGIVMDQLLHRMDYGDPVGRILLFEPSPLFLWNFQRERRRCPVLIRARLTVVASTPEETEIYRDVFHEIADIYDQADQIPTPLGGYPLEVLFSRDRQLLSGKSLSAPATSLARMYQVLTKLSVGGTVLMTLPQAVFSNQTENESFFGTLSEMKIHPMEIIKLPNCLSTSSPREKCLVIGKRCPDDLYSKKGQLRTHLIDTVYRRGTAPGEYFLIIKKCSAVLTGTALKACERLYEKLRTVMPAEEKIESAWSSSHKSLTEFRFSKEIRLYYRMMPNRHHREWGGYAELKELSWSSRRRHRGKKILGTEEKLLGDTQEEVLRLIKNVPFYPTMSQLILLEMEKLRKSEPTTRFCLKTMWYCLQGSLQKKYVKYDPKLCRGIFCDESPESIQMQDLIPGGSDQAELLSTIEQAIGLYTDYPKAWVQIHLVLKEAVHQGLLEYDPLYGSSYFQSQREPTGSLASILKELREDFLQDDAEWKIVQYLTAPKDPEKRSKAPRYVTDSLYLAAALRWQTAMSAAEIRCLRWSDFQESTIDSGYYLMDIAKFRMEDNVTDTYYVRTPHWYRKRRIGLSKLMTGWLLERRKFLIDLGYTDDELKDLPIVMPKEPARRYIHTSRTSQIASIKSISKIWDELMRAAEIESNPVPVKDATGWQEVDLADASRFDVPKSNFTHQAVMKCRFLPGLLAWYTGRTFGSVFDSHYCDYSLEYIQSSVTDMLDAWVGRYLSETAAGSIHKKIPVTKDTPLQTQISRPYAGDEISCAELSIQTSCHTKAHVALTISSGHGVSGVVRKRGDE